MLERLRRLARQPRPEPPGCYGKVPELGDFLSRRIPQSMLSPWDAWLQTLLTASRGQLGPAWPSAWLHMPVWRGLVGDGLLSDGRVWVVLIPSVDRVGRRFPFSILAAAAPGGTAPDAWLAAAEALALTVLEPRFDAARFDAALQDLGSPAPGAAKGALDNADAGFSPLLDARSALPAELADATATLPAGRSLWWRRDPNGAGGAALRAHGLPAAALAGAFVRGGGQGVATSEPFDPVT